jgi:hypothetical protein
MNKMKEQPPSQIVSILSKILDKIPEYPGTTIGMKYDQPSDLDFATPWTIRSP